MFGKTDWKEWTPLTIDTFFTEGWFDANVGPPNGPGGSLRQGWVGVPDAFFDRQVVLFDTYTQGVRGNPNFNSFDLEYTGEHNPGIVFSDIKDIHNRTSA